MSEGQGSVTGDAGLARAVPAVPQGHISHERVRPVPLIHNMSCRPTVTITHKSAALCRRLAFMSSAWPNDPNAFADYCGTFGLPAVAVEDGYAHLVKAANEPCPQLSRLPPLAAVLRNAPGESIPGLTDDPRLLLAVLTRCFGSIFMRDAPPSVTTDTLRRPVTLLIPHSWNLNP